MVEQEALLRFRRIGREVPGTRALADRNYLEPTPVQARVIPEILAGRDILAPVRTIVVAGAYDRVRDAIFDPAPLIKTLDLERFTGREWLLWQLDEALESLSKGYMLSGARRASARQR